MKKIIAVLGALTLAFSLAACSTGTVNPPPRPDTNGVMPLPTPEAEAPEPEPEDGPLAFGQASAWEDGIEMLVEQPVGYAPSEYAAGATQPNNITIRITITNNSAANLEPMTFSSLASGGVQGSQIFDVSNDLGMAPSTTILPGATISWTEAWSITDPADITYQVAPSFDHDDAIWTNR